MAAHTADHRGPSTAGDDTKETTVGAADERRCGSPVRQVVGPPAPPSAAKGACATGPAASSGPPSAPKTSAVGAVVLVKRPDGTMLVKAAGGYAITPVYDDASGALMGARVARGAGGREADGGGATEQGNSAKAAADDDASIPSTPPISTVGDDDPELGERSVTINGFICPITKELPEHPVMLRGDGRFYERDSIAAWLANHNRSPMTNLELTHTGRELIESSGISILFESLKTLTVNAQKLAAAARSYKFAAKLNQRSRCTHRGRSRAESPPKAKRYSVKEFKRGWREAAKLDRSAYNGWRRTLFPREEDRERKALFINLGSDAERWAFHQALPRVLDENPRIRASLRELVFWWGGTDDQRVLAAACVETLIAARQLPALRKVRFWDVGHHVRRDILAELGDAMKRGLRVKFASQLSDAKRE